MNMLWSKMTYNGSNMSPVRRLRYSNFQAPLQVLL